MTQFELELEQESNIEYLQSLICAWRSEGRMAKKLFIFIGFVCAVAVYFTFSFLLGDIWGYIATIVVFFASAYCADTLGVSFKSNTASDGKFAYEACVTMEILIEIYKGTYRQNGVHIISIGTGKHRALYKEFIHYYPDYKCRALAKLATINVKHEDIFN